MAQKRSRPNLWMPMYWGDYLRDTGHLNAQEHGAYLMLIAHYWCTGRPLADNDALLAKMARVSLMVWKKLRPTVGAFFEITNGLWIHKRVERELLEAFDRKETAAERAKAGAKARWLKHTKRMLEASPKQCLPMPNTYTIQESESESSKISTVAERMNHELAELAKKRRLPN